MFLGWVVAHRQPVGCHTRAEGQPGACHERQLRGRTVSLRGGARQDSPRSSHENSVVEQGHRRLKNALDQALILRGSRDFESEDEYRTFVKGVVDRRNRLVSSKLKRERRPLPPAPVPEYANYRCRVRRWSTIRVANRTYSVPSRLIGMEVDVRLHSDYIEVYYKGHLVESMERIHGTGEAHGQAPIKSLLASAVGYL